MTDQEILSAIGAAYWARKLPMVFSGEFDEERLRLLRHKLWVGRLYGVGLEVAAPDKMLRAFITNHEPKSELESILVANFRV